jgi:hypothetical protein
MELQNIWRISEFHLKRGVNRMQKRTNEFVSVYDFTIFALLHIQLFLQTHRAERDPQTSKILDDARNGTKPTKKDRLHV